MSKNKRKGKYISPHASEQSPSQHVTEFREELIFSGPIPHPAILERYNQTVPGAAERIIVMAEQQAIHRRTLEKSVIDSDVKKSERGQLFAFVIAITGLILYGWLGLNGQELAAGLIGGGEVVSLAGLFIYGRHQKAKERERAKEQSPIK